MKNKLYYIVGVFVLVAISVIIAIFLTSRGSGSVIDISIPSKSKVFHRTSSMILGPGTSQKLYFHKAGWFLKKIEFRLPDVSSTEFEIKALITAKGQKPREEDWSHLGKKIFCLDKRDENIKDIVLTINNNSQTANLKDDIQVFAMREGCNEWSGSFKYEWTDKLQNKNEQGTLQATFTLKENSYATEFVVADGGYTYSLLGCSRGAETKTYTKIGDDKLQESALRLIPMDDGGYELKIPAVWGRTDKASEYIKRNNTCIYGKEYGDKANALDEESISTLNEVMAEKFILVPDSLTGNLTGSKEITKKMDDGTERKIKVSWDLTRQ
ncbi:MAG: hypothetical protein WC459_02935 [Patescibacteria group bacterium]